MFKRPKRQLTERQNANRVVNRLLTYALIVFIFYNTFFSVKKPELKHFTFAKENFTPVKFPPIAKVKNLDNGTIETYIVDNNGLTLHGNNVVNIAP